MEKMINFAFMKSNFQVVFKTACTQTEARKKGFELAKQYNTDIRCEEFSGPRRRWEFLATTTPTARAIQYSVTYAARRTILLT